MMKQADRVRGGASGLHLPFTAIDGRSATGCLLLCDHASNQLPEGYGTLGLPQEQLERHIGYDIGAAGVTRELARLLGAPALLTNYSRLLIDANRGEDDPTLIMRISDGAVVPGNADFGDGERALRVEQFYQPYHQAIDNAIDTAISEARPPAILSIHSFTENWRGSLRPWHATILWDNDPRLPRPMLEALRAEPDLVIGENVPYSGELKGDCLYRHGTRRGLAHALIEIRQDLIGSKDGQHEWAIRLKRILEPLLQAPGAAAIFNQIRHHGSNTDSRRPAPAVVQA